MTAKYALHPGPVTSKNDGDRHFIDAHTLARLYRVRPAECVVVPWEAPAPEESEREAAPGAHQAHGAGAPVPDYHGRYTLPGA